MQITKALVEKIAESPLEERLGLLVDEILRVDLRFRADIQMLLTNFRPKRRPKPLWIGCGRR
jgi:hypothetical protein